MSRLPLVLAALAPLAACESYGGLNRESLAACVAGAGITGSYESSFSLRNDRTSYLVREGPNVSRAQAEAANACIATAIAAAPAQAAGTIVVAETFTYGSPPPAAPDPSLQVIQVVGAAAPTAPVTVAVASAPAPALPAAGQASVIAQPVATRPCRLEMRGGSGYACR